MSTIPNEITQETLDYVLDFCNKVRRAGGAEPLEGLLPAIPSKSNACLVARGLNFACEVQPAFEGGPSHGNSFRKRATYEDATPKWYMLVEDEATVRRIASELNLPLEEVARDDYPDTSTEVAILLPRELAAVAMAYDVWFSDLQRRTTVYNGFSSGYGYRYTFVPEVLEELKKSPFYKLVERDALNRAACEITRRTNVEVQL